MDSPPDGPVTTRRVPVVPYLRDDALDGLVVYLQTRLQDAERCVIDFDGRRIVLEQSATDGFCAHDTLNERRWRSDSLSGLVRELLGDASITIAG